MRQVCCPEGVEDRVFKQPPERRCNGLKVKLTLFNTPLLRS